jgi:hypothetical protein
VSHEHIGPVAVEKWPPGGVFADAEAKTATTAAAAENVLKRAFVLHLFFSAEHSTGWLR